VGAPPFAGALADNAMEDAGQISLIGEARLNYDLGERQRCFEPEIETPSAAA
jgi:hypothetical protein